MNSREHSKHISRYEQIKAALVKAQDYRDHFPGAEWTVHERYTVWLATNKWRKSMSPGAPLITLEQIMACENMAAGHVDYTKKFALYAAELLLED